MNDQRRIRLLLGVIGALVLLNIGLLSWFWLKPNPATHRRNRPTMNNSGTFLADTLQFSPAQKAQLATLQKSYFQQLMPKQQALRKTRRAYFRLTDDQFNDAQRRIAVMEFHRQAADLELLTLAHFDRVAGICTPQQRQLLNRLLSEVPSRRFRMPGTRRGGH